MATNTSLINAWSAQPAQFAPSNYYSERNLLLAGLTPNVASRLHKHLQEHEFAEGTVLWHAGQKVTEVFFPVSGIVSIGVPTRDGRVIEVAIVGREGAAGFHDRSGAFAVATQAVIRAAGRFMSISAQLFAAAELDSVDIRRIGDVSTGWLMLQSQQMAACNAVHSAEARFCRWLLRASDALAEDKVPVTQEIIAQALGIRRTTATLIAQQLQMRGAIAYSRGKIAIRDRSALEAAACDCHRVLARSYWPSELLRNGPVSGARAAVG
jgi:CRP-like cAMP-binding protein